MQDYNTIIGSIPIEELRMMAPKEVEYLFYPQKNLQRKMSHFQISSITMTESMHQGAA